MKQTDLLRRPKIRKNEAETYPTKWVKKQYKIKQKIGVTKKAASHFSHMASRRIYQKVDVFVDRLSYTPISIHRKNTNHY